jgi:hypothetical protein
VQAANIRPVCKFFIPVFIHNKVNGCKNGWGRGNNMRRLFLVAGILAIELSKARQVKQGRMQELLTGRIQLV